MKKKYYNFQEIYDILENDDDFYNLSLKITAPSLFYYVSYIINDALSKNVKRLYFLARDGYPLLKIAEIICEKYNFDIELRYLYCSRLSLKPAFLAKNFSQALQEICVKSTTTTYKSILISCGLAENDINFALDKLNCHENFLSQKEVDDFYNQILENKEISDLILNISTTKLENLRGYFKKSGLYDNLSYAFVDSGWSGTMQNAIFDILDIKEKKVSGYYFGMYKEFSTPSNEFNVFMFSPSYHYSRSYTFNNNLFECLCSANHGMTIGYENEDFSPILKDFSPSFDIKTQHKAIFDFALEFTKRYDFPKIKNDKEVYKALKKLMHSPSSLEAEIFGSIKFSDEPSEATLCELASYLSLKELFGNFFFSRIFANLTGKKKAPESFWYIATAKRFYPCLTWICKINFFAVSYVYYKIKK